MMIHLKSFGSVLREAVRGFIRHKDSRMGAALAFYTLLSLSPLLLIVLSIIGPIFGTDAARGAIGRQIEQLVGHEGARAVEAIVSNANHPTRGIISTVVGVLVLLFGASGVIVELKEALNDIWETPPAPPEPVFGLRSLAIDRLLAFSLICAIAFLLLVSLFISAFLTTIGDLVVGERYDQAVWANLLNIGLSFLLTTSLFALIFRRMPAQRTPWRFAILGAFITSLLFLLGKSLIGLYMGRAAVGSAFGAAGSLVVLLVWVYYSTQILLFGAEVTRVYDLRSRTK